jgi:predicted RNA-binding Zn-ribbon protein involved in translation (DUF1610 family)|tara:strand:- start:127 stop:564 length:438 start_codon:yes stop_codon:yes gene_type:complete
MPKNKKKKKEQYVKVCPKCKFINVTRDKSSILQKTGALPLMYICNHCGHTGYQFPEIRLSELKNFQKDVDKGHLRYTKKDKTEMIDTAYGKFVVRIFWKVTSITTILGGILVLSLNYVAYGIGLILLGLFMFYITYFKKRKLKDE